MTTYMAWSCNASECEYNRHFAMVDRDVVSPQIVIRLLEATPGVARGALVSDKDRTKHFCDEVCFQSWAMGR